MEMEDIIGLPDSTISGNDGESNEEAGEDMKNRENFGCKDIDIVAKIGMTGPETLNPNENNFGTDRCTIGSTNLELNGENVKSVINENTQLSMQTEVDMDLVDSPIGHVDNEVAGIVSVPGNLSSSGFDLNSQNGCLNAKIHNHLTNGGPVSGVKRARITYDEQQPSVHVTYNSLTSGSKQKLKELLQQWSEWHVQHGSLSKNLDEVLESGEETYFPAFYVGTEKSSAVSFWIENQTQKQKLNDFNPDSDSVPLYDRGFALGLTSTDGPSNAEGGLEIVNEAARCFNCGSYNHSLKDCPKPRDNVAVNNARNLHKLKRNQNAGSRNATRYYQNSYGGKYDGLKPGSLDAETRKLLGLGESDPPPWLNRMRQLGYPPGYLDPDDEDQPSGITIFADEDSKEEHENGEIFESKNPDPQRKMAVKFPGINAPIPENADQREWAAGPSSYGSYGKRPLCKSNNSSETIGRWHHHERWGSREFVDDGPPGENSVLSMSSYPPRYDDYDSGYSFSSRRFSSPSIWRSHSEKEWSLAVHEKRLFEDEADERYMTVEFPGINAPIPENADQRVWAAGPCSYGSYENQPLRKLNNSSETIGRWHHHERWGSREFVDEGPPGEDSIFSISSYPPRYGNYDSGYSFRSPRFSSPSIWRSHSEKEWSLSVHEESLFEDETDERWNDAWPDYSRQYFGDHEHDRYGYDLHGHRSWR